MSRLSDMLRQQEGVRNKTYTDSLGFHTWGVGHRDDHSPIGEFHTDEQVNLQLDTDIAAATGALEHALPWVVSLDPVRRDVLINMAFNMGVGKLLGFKNTLAFIQAGKWDEAADGMLNSLWAKQVKGRAVTLSDMMRTGCYPK